MPRLGSFDESFFDTAPHRWARSWDVPAPADDFWADFVDRPLHWCRALRIEWTSERPFGVGATRTVTVLHTLRGVEQFFLWEEGRRQAFHFTRANLPGLRRFGEYYDIEPTGAGSCRFTWKLAAEPTTAGKAAVPALHLLVANLYGDTTRHFAST